MEWMWRRQKVHVATGIRADIPNNNTHSQATRRMARRRRGYDTSRRGVVTGKISAPEITLNYWASWRADTSLMQPRMSEPMQ